MDDYNGETSLSGSTEHGNGQPTNVNIQNLVEYEGTSSTNELNITNESGDLEMQIPVPTLTKTQRVMNVLHHFIPIKQTYERISNGLVTGRMQSNIPGRFIGQGTDGVFRNLMAKPDTNSNQIKNETNPPTYEEAAADATPEYWETSVIAPIYEDEVFVEGLPVGNVANFVWNALVTVAFQFVGFLLCYILHTSHAAKHGSRSGLGITFIFYGWNLIPSNFGNSTKLPQRYEPKNPNAYDMKKEIDIGDGGVDDYKSELMGQKTLDSDKAPYFAYGLIAFGILMILKAVMDYYKVKQTEKSILQPRLDNSVTTTSMNPQSLWEQPSDNSHHDSPRESTSSQHLETDSDIE